MISTLIFALNVVAGAQYDQLDDHLDKREYLKASRHLTAMLERDFEPQAIRRYTVLLTDQYIHQIAFRAFFLRDMLVQEDVQEMRHSERPIIAGKYESLAEQNLEALLLRARETYPNSLDIQFSIAHYLWAGKCCISESKLRMDTAKLTDVLKRAYADNLYTATSLLALGELDPENAPAYYEKAWKIEPGRSDVGSAYLGSLYDLKDWERIPDVAARVFEANRDLPTRLFTLHSTAEAYWNRGDCVRTMEAVDAVLKMAPDHFAVWAIGLKCQRKDSEFPVYKAYLDRFIHKNPNDPQPFFAYLGYLKQYGVMKRDHQYVEAMVAQASDGEIEDAVRWFEASGFFHLIGDSAQAAGALNKSLAIARSVEDPPLGLVEMLEDAAASQSSASVKP